MFRLEIGDLQAGTRLATHELGMILPRDGDSQPDTTDTSSNTFDQRARQLGRVAVRVEAHPAVRQGDPLGCQLREHGVEPCMRHGVRHPSTICAIAPCIAWVASTVFPKSAYNTPDAGSQRAWNATPGSSPTMAYASGRPSRRAIQMP